MTARMLASEVGDELRVLLREPLALLFSVAMPVGFFALFATLYGGERTAGGLPVGTAMLATFGTFGVVGVTLLNPGVGVAEDRESGWLRAKRVSAMPPSTALTAKVVATLPYALGVLLAMTAVALLNGTLALGPLAWLRLAGLLLAGGIPFALTGLAVGFVTKPQSATAILNAFFIPAAVASGLWLPLESLPQTIQQIAPALPTYHLAQLALGQIAGSAVGVHLLALVAWTAGSAAVAAVAYRRSRP